MTHRTPPKPEGYKADWKLYGVLATPATQRKALFARDSGVCKLCGSQDKPWIYEHIIPLWLVDRSDYPRCLKYWSLEYGETRCVDCSKPKTKLESKARAKIKRIRGETCTGIKKKIPNRPMPKPTPEQKEKLRAMRREQRKRISLWRQK